MKSYRLLVLLLFLPIVPVASAAPDTPPALTWETMIPPSAFCNDEALVDMAVSETSFVYVLIHCKTGASFDEDDGYLLFRLNPSGSMVWNQAVIPAPVGTESYIPTSVDVDPAGRAWVWYDVNAALTYLDVWGTSGSKVWDNIDDFTQPMTVTRTTFEELNATTFNAYSGGPAARVGQACTTSLECEVTFELIGNPGIGNAYYAGPYHDALYGEDANNGASASEAYIVTRSTGAIADSESYGTFGSQSEGHVWFNPTTDTVALPYGKTGASTHPHYAEFNKTTLTTVRDIEPIESNVFTYDENFVDDKFVDGVGSVFYCGLASTPGVKRDSYLSKFNSTTNMGMRWNITVNKVGTTLFERAQSCGLGGDGSVYVGLKVCDASQENCDAYVRKYAGAGIALDPQDVFENFSDLITPTTTPPPFAGGGAIGFKDFCLAVGFEDGPGKFLCGLIIVLTGAGIMAYVLADKKENGMPRFGKASVFAGGGTFAGLAMFVTFIELWPIITLALMCVFAAALVALVTKRQFGS